MLLQKRVDQIVALRILLLFGHFPLSQGYDPTHKLSDTLSVGETAMVQQTLGFVEGDFQPKRLIGDKGYDSDALDQTLAELGIEMISPHGSNRRPENLTQA